MKYYRVKFIIGDKGEIRYEYYRLEEGTTHYEFYHNIRVGWCMGLSPWERIVNVFKAQEVNKLEVLIATGSL